jgi:GNAT superfamily N-acetyltransferase
MARRLGPGACAVHRLIHALAVYEKEPNAMVTTVQDFERDGFETSPPLFHSALAEISKDGGASWIAVGVAFFFVSYSSWTGKTLYLEDIFVEVEWRKVGLGSRLMEHAVDAAMEMSCARLQWFVANLLGIFGPCL